MKKLLVITLLLCACAVTGLAQAEKKAEMPAASVASGHVGKKEVIFNWGQSAQLVIMNSDAMPADKFDFRPAKGVRSHAEQVKHVAGSAAVLMAWVLGREMPKGGNDVYLHLKTKDEIMATLKKDFQSYTEAMKQMTEAQFAEQVETQFFGKVSRADVVMRLMGHNNRHYGQMVVYLRLNDVVPPASRPQ
jgi:uncharacterized damage-inducible protein DinB